MSNRHVVTAGKFEGLILQQQCSLWKLSKRRKYSVRRGSILPEKLRRTVNKVFIRYYVCLWAEGKHSHYYFEYVLSKILILTVIRWTKTYVPRLMAQCKSSDSCAAWRHAKLSEQWGVVLFKNGHVFKTHQNWKLIYGFVTLIIVFKYLP
jgi:hypothetical protein